MNEEIGAESELGSVRVIDDGMRRTEVLDGILPVNEPPSPRLREHYRQLFKYRGKSEDK